MRVSVQCVPGTRIIFEALNIAGDGYVFGNGDDVRLYLWELQTTGVFKAFDWADNTFKSAATTLTTAYASMTQQDVNNGSISTNQFTKVLTSLGAFTAGNTYYAYVQNHTQGDPTEREAFVYARTGGALKIEDGGIVAATLASGTITAAKFGAGAIDATAIASDAIAAAKIATGAITAAKFAADAITATVIADNAIDAAALAADCITAAKIADNAIDAGAIASNAITSAKIASGAITSSTFAASAIDATAIASSAITAAKIATDAITAAKIADGAIDAATLAADLDVYEAVATLDRDSVNAQDEWTVYFRKNGAQYTGTVTTPVLTVTLRDATVLFSSAALTQVGSTGFYKVDKLTTERVSLGDTYLAQVTATIAGSSRTFAAAIARDV